MDDNSPGTVSLDNGIGDLPEGSWDAQNRTYTILYSDLDYITIYTITISGFQDLAGNVMDSDVTDDFTTVIQPLVPTVWPTSLTLDKGSSASLSIDLGQGQSAASSAAITVADSSIADVSSSSLSSTDTIIVTGLHKGTTEITVTFDDPAPTIVEIPVTVNPVIPLWPSGSSLTASNITRRGVTLTWTPAQDLTAVTGYRIYRDGKLLAEVAGDVSSYNVSGLAASHRYSFQVQAGNADDEWTDDGPTVSIKTKSKSSGSNSESNQPSNTTNQQEPNPAEGVDYTALAAKFIDVEKHWALQSINYVVGRGLFRGISETEFSPDTPITRGMLVTVLGRLAAIDANNYKAASFIDVPADHIFAPYIEWAYQKDLIKEASPKLFAPDRPVPREEIAAVLVNYAKATGLSLPANRQAASYVDQGLISSENLEAVKALQQAGIMTGGTGNLFNPQSYTSRAEFASILHRYLKLTTDPE